MVVALVLAVACGSPEGADDEFTFDPVPYVTIEDGTPISLKAEDCTPYIADQVTALVHRGNEEQFESWIADVGFAVLRKSESRTGPTIYFIRVPVASVPDALSFIRERPEIQAADAAYIGGVPEEPTATPPPGLECSGS